MNYGGIVGYGVMPYAVDLDRLRAEVGSGDADLAHRYGLGYAESDRHGEIADMVEGAFPGDDAPSLQDVARHVIMGEPCTEGVGFAYGYFLKYLCELQGAFLGNADWYPVPLSFATEMDEALAEVGISSKEFSTFDLIFGGPPVPLPPIDDFPGIGYMAYADLEGPKEQLAVLGPDVPPPYDGAVYSLFQWLAHAHSDKRSLVCFYH